MKIEKFEEWFEKYKNNFDIDIDADITYPRSLEANIHVYKIMERNQFNTNDEWSDKLKKVAKNINKVQPKEDRDFLILKYSEYLV